MPYNLTEFEGIVVQGGYSGLFYISNDTGLLLASLIQSAWFYVPGRELTDAEVDRVKELKARAFYEVTKMLTGQIITSLQQTTPEGTLPMDGSTYLATEYPELFNVLPASMKTATDFTLPDMNGALIGQDNAGLGTIVGQNEVTQTIDQMPEHQHFYARETPQAIVQGELAPATVAGTSTVSVATQTAGGGQPMDIRNTRLIARFYVVSGR